MNILLLSTIYPLPGAGNHGTKVCHFFAKEWLAMGYRVRVIHIQAVYPYPLYWLAKVFRNYIAAKTGAVVYTKRDKKALQYEMDEVPIYRIPVYKPYPHAAFSPKSINKSIENIIKANATENFIPDIIIGHFPNPQLQFLYELKTKYKNAKTCEVLHLPAELVQLDTIYGKNLQKYFNSIDVWGFRFNHLKNLFNAKYGNVSSSFICYSGVPSSYICTKKRNICQPPSKYLYVGEMISRKFPEKVLEALQLVYSNKSFHLSYIGDGGLMNRLSKMVNENGLQENVDLLGKIPRDQIIKKYDYADCFIMISKGEAYGLVYLEAMARGCITIASRNEGFDGIIIDGVNGFLCEAGNAKELSKIIQRINALSNEERQKISNMAIETAKWLTDYNAAKMYIENVIRL